MNSILVDFSKPYGKVKEYNAVNNGPVKGMRGFSNIDSWSLAHIPYGRLHDTSYTNEWLVDVHRIFRNFDANENDPENYVFAPTDKYLQRMFEAGTKPYYRLGASIEHSHHFGTYPPKDYLKWARICEHIIRHYTEGWANGFTMDIEYWEIWNEADNYNPSGNPCWQGTPELFVDFFSTVCPYLQEKFPKLKIGGPAIATFGHKEWCELFFSEMKRRGVRPDFISYHRYNKDVTNFVEYVREANALMEKYGYGDIETHLNEWNYIRGWRGEDFEHSVRSIKGLKGSSFVNGVICALHPEKLDMLMYYDGRLCGFCGLWDTTFMNPLKTYYSFIAFDKLKNLGTAVESVNAPDLYSLAATDGKNGGILLTYFDQNDGIPDKDVTLRVRNYPITEGETLRVRYHLIDETHDLEKVCEALFATPSFDLPLHLPPYVSYYIEIVKE